MWKNFVRDYFSFSRRQRKGLFILCALILILKIMPVLLPYLLPNREQDHTAFRKAVTAFLSRQGSKAKDRDISASPPARLFPFDPNTLSVKGWQQLGLSRSVAITIRHYRAAGGHFYKKEDLKKIYGLSPGTYQKLAPYIKIKRARKQEPENPPPVTAHKKPASPAVPHATYHYSHKTVRIDINKADSAAWCRLYGIGPVLSARIIRFKKALGGFCKIAQIAEVYGLPDSTFQHIKRQLNISKVSLRKLNINKAPVDKLKSHPYISYRLAASIKAFREMHGSFDSLPELKRLQLVNDGIYRKLVPYLSVK